MIPDHVSGAAMQWKAENQTVVRCTKESNLLRKTQKMTSFRLEDETHFILILMVGCYSLNLGLHFNHKLHLLFLLFLIIF